MTALRVALLLARPARTGAAAVALPATAFAVVTALLLVVVGGARTFWRWDDDLAPLYQGLAVVAVALLAVPLVALGGAAARLSARRRDDRLATLRLLGATPRLVRLVVVAESAVVAAAGAVAGVVLAAALSPLVGLVRFRGEAVGAARLWPGLPAVAAVLLLVVAVAVLSGVLGLRRVVVEPLGVRARQQPPPQRWVRAAGGAAVVLVWVAAWQVGSATLRSSLALVALLGGGLAACLGVLSLVGPFALSRLAGRSLRRAGTPQRLLAARAVLDDPRAAWRQVAGVAMTSFTGVVAGVGLAVVRAAGDGGDARDAELVADVRTGVLLTLVGSFLVVACSAGVTAAAAVLDRRDVWVALDRAGMPRQVMEAARARAVLAPLRQVALGSALVGAVAVLPVTGAALVLDPVAVLVVVACLVAGTGLVALALRATRPVLTAVLAAPHRA